MRFWILKDTGLEGYSNLTTESKVKSYCNVCDLAWTWEVNSSERSWKIKELLAPDSEGLLILYVFDHHRSIYQASINQRQKKRIELLVSIVLTNVALSKKSLLSEISGYILASGNPIEILMMTKNIR